MNKENCTLKLVAEIILYYDARSKKHQNGYDGVATPILKKCNTIISKPHSYICNKSIQTGVFPNRLKYSILEPLFKNGNRPSISN